MSKLCRKMRFLLESKQNELYCKYKLKCCLSKKIYIFIYKSSKYPYVSWLLKLSDLSNSWNSWKVSLYHSSILISMKIRKMTALCNLVQTDRSIKTRSLPPRDCMAQHPRQSHLHTCRLENPELSFNKNQFIRYRRRTDRRTDGQILNFNKYSAGFRRHENFVPNDNPHSYSVPVIRGFTVTFYRHNIRKNMHLVSSFVKLALNWMYHFACASKHKPQPVELNYLGLKVCISIPALSCPVCIDEFPGILPTKQKNSWRHKGLLANWCLSIE
jgi:hypothetical protein